MILQVFLLATGFVFVAGDLRSCIQRLCKISDEVNTCCYTAFGEGGGFEENFKRILTDSFVNPLKEECQSIGQGRQGRRGSIFSRNRNIASVDNNGMLFGSNRRRGAFSRSGLGRNSESSCNSAIQNSPSCQEFQTQKPEGREGCQGWSAKLEECLNSLPQWKILCPGSNSGSSNPNDNFRNDYDMA